METKRTQVPEFLALTTTMSYDVKITSAAGERVETRYVNKPMYLCARNIIGIIDVEGIEPHANKTQLIVTDGTDYYVKESIDEIVERLAEINLGL